MPKLPLIGAVLLLLVAYVLAPGVALFRLDQAVRHGNVATVARLVDWPAVRQGLAEEVAGGILGAPGRHGPPAAGDLPPFGFSFVSHLADHAITARLTPRGLIRLARADSAAGAPPPRARLAGVWFGGPRQVTIRLRLTGQPQPIRLRLRLERGGWKLDRVWLPAILLRRAADPDPPTGAHEPPRTATVDVPTP